MPDDEPPHKLHRFPRAERALILKPSHRTKRQPTRLSCSKKPPHIRFNQASQITARQTNARPEQKRLQPPAIQMPLLQPPLQLRVHLSIPKSCMVVKDSQQGPRKRLLKCEDYLKPTGATGLIERLLQPCSSMVGSQTTRQESSSFVVD